jgi:hypothetical protein
VSELCKTMLRHSTLAAEEVRLAGHGVDAPKSGDCRQLQAGS